MGCHGQGALQADPVTLTTEYPPRDHIAWDMLAQALLIAHPCVNLDRKFTAPQRDGDILPGSA